MPIKVTRFWCLWKDFTLSLSTYVCVCVCVSQTLTKKYHKASNQPYIWHLHRCVVCSLVCAHCVPTVCSIEKINVTQSVPLPCSARPQDKYPTPLLPDSLAAGHWGSVTIMHGFLQHCKAGSHQRREPHYLSGEATWPYDCNNIYIDINKLFMYTVQWDGTTDTYTWVLGNSSS